MFMAGETLRAPLNMSEQRQKNPPFQKRHKSEKRKILALITEPGNTEGKKKITQWNIKWKMPSSFCSTSGGPMAEDAADKCPPPHPHHL